MAIDLSTALLILQAIAPDVVLRLWSLACAAAIMVGLALGMRLQLEPATIMWPAWADPAVLAERVDAARRARRLRRLRRPLVTPSGGHVGRHWGIDPAADGEPDRWRAVHTADVVEHGQHHAGDHAWSTNLIQDTLAADFTVDDLDDLMARAR